MKVLLVTKKNILEIIMAVEQMEHEGLIVFISNNENSIPRKLHQSNEKISLEEVIKHRRKQNPINEIIKLISRELEPLPITFSIEEKKSYFNQNSNSKIKTNKKISKKIKNYFSRKV